MPTILVADDDANIRELVCLFLRNEGFETLEAEDGMEHWPSMPRRMSILSFSIL